MAERRGTSAEVERIRQLLEGMTGGPIDVSGARKGRAPATDARREQTGAPAAGDPVSAHACIAARGSSLARGGAGSSIAWTCAGGAERARKVPTCVARKFGEGDRAFRDEGALLEEIDRCQREACWERVLSMVKARERSSQDVSDRLCDEGFPRQIAHEAADRALRCSLIDDARFGEVFVRSKIRAGWGRARIERALEQQGVTASTIPGYPGEFFSAEGEEDRAWSLLERRSVPERNPEQKLARYLVNKGFGMGLSMRLARRRVSQCAAEQTGDEASVPHAG